MALRFDAVIAGGGPAGSTMAILLAHAGWSVALVEKQRFPRRKVCGECVAASNLPLIEALGIGGAFQSMAGPPLTRVALWRGARSVLADLPAARHPHFRWGRALGRDTLDTLLLERARALGVAVMQPWRVHACARWGETWWCEVRGVDHSGALEFETPVLIDAHGSWERPFAQALDRATPRDTPGDSDLFAFKATFAEAALPRGLLPVLSFDGGYGGMVVADAATTTLACCVRRDRLAAWRALRPGLPAGEVVEHALRSVCLGVRQALAPARRESAWLAVGPLHPGVRVHTRDGILRIGNAAGEAHPILGEGLSMAMQSATLLAALLVRRPVPRAGLDAWRAGIGHAYATAWTLTFERRRRIAALFAHAAMGARSGRALMAVARVLPALLTVGARLGGKATTVALPPPTLLEGRGPATSAPLSPPPRGAAGTARIIASDPRRRKP